MQRLFHDRLGLRALAVLALAATLLATTRAQTATATRPKSAASAAPSSTKLDPGTARLLELATHDNHVQEHLQHLTKEIGPRLTGSRHFDKAAEWARERFASFGLDARLEQWGEFPVAFDRGVQTGRMVLPEPKDLVFITRSWTVGTQGKVRAAAHMEPADQAELDQAKAELAGAWIVRRAKRPDSAFRKELDKALEAAKPAGILRSGGKDGLLVMSGSQRVDLDKLDLKKGPEITLRNDHYDELVARLEKGDKVELEFEIENRFERGPVACNDVVADIKGSEFPDEFVLVGGHLDSWDAAEGAQDNGTGTATTLEAARLIALLHKQPKRTIRFLLFGGEEEGLFGSAGYVKTHAQELDKISVVFVHDGGQNPLRGLEVTYPMIDDMEKVFAPVMNLDPERPFKISEVDGIHNSGDSDHASFIDKGVPGFFWDQSEEGYDHVHHTQYDTFETIDPANQLHNSRVIAIGAWGMANLDHRLDRTDSESGRPRRLGVMLDGVKVRSIDDGKAKIAGWEAGDVILSIDGVALADRQAVSRELNNDGPLKKIRLRRGDKELDTVVDYSGDPGEAVRGARAERRAAWLAKRKAIDGH